ncbi:MAG: TonB-dependent receptor [Nostoc sp.]|uniref:TonB-dependent receptor n=1 Tax=Nostoc sp. TaxID=1180 RepID=UPI002FF4D702
MTNKLQQVVLMVSTLFLLGIAPGLAQTQAQKFDLANIPSIREIKLPLTSAEMLVQSPISEVVQVTQVQANPTGKGVDIILQTLLGQQLQLVNRSAGNSFIVDVPNAQLRLPSGEAFTFRSDKPIAGVTEITVTNFDAKTIRVSVTGEKSIPTVELYDSANEGIIFSVASTAPRGQQVQPQTQQPPSQTQPSQPSAQGDQPIELVVTGEQDSYNASNATTATRTDTPLRDIPQSIQVVPQQVLKDQQTFRLTDALRNVSGVQSGSSFGGTRDVFSIRGFGGVIFKDGFRQNGDRTIINETANLERIEVLKGPASVLFGTVEPGGIINLVTKQPLLEPFYSVELQAGSFGLVRPSIDFSGPLNRDRTLLYRLNAVYESNGNFRDFDQGVYRFFVSPVVTWKISDRTDLTFEFSYLDDTRPFDITGIPPIGRKIADIPYSRVVDEPDNISFRNELSASYRLEHRFSENWTLRNAFRFSSSDQRFIGARYSTLDETTGNLSRSWSDNKGTNQSYSLQTNLIGKFATGSVKHTLLFGVDLNRDINDLHNYFAFGGAPGINIFNPVYRVTPRPRREDLPFNVTFNNSLDYLGIYLQDQVALADNLKLLLGGRFDIVDQGSSFTNSAGANTNTQVQANAFTPRIGIVYQPVPPLSLYASYSQSFAPNTATTVSGSILEPERGTQYEVGIRGEFFNSRLSANLAAYDITKTNVATTDPNNTDYSIAVGEQGSQGIELDVAGEILPGWNIIANYGYTDAKVTKDNSPLQGNRFEDVPYNGASLWTTYQIQRGDLQGLGFGLGLFYVGEREGDLENTYELSSYLRTDASIFYKRNNWRAGINFKNIFDVNYIEGTYSRQQITPGAPFAVLGTFSIEF